MSFFWGKKPSNEIISKYQQLGFDKHLITQAWESCKGNENILMDHLFYFKQQQNKMAQDNSISPLRMSSPGVYRFREETEFKNAIELSLADQKNFYEPLNPEQRLRPRRLPVGLKNVGNTCYVNSLFQSYFMSERFVAAVLSFDPNVVFVEEYMTNSESSKVDRDIKQVRIEASIKLMKALQKLFALMIKSHKKYVDPSEVLNLVVDDMGQKIPIGDQRDLSEYHLNFLSRIEEAFYYQEKFRKAKKGGKESPSLVSIEELPTSYVSFASSTRSLQFESLISSPLSTSQENSFISKHFFGKMKQIMTFNQDGEKITQEKDIILGPIILDSSVKSLFQGLEKYCQFQIEDYQAPNGELTKAEGSLWMIRPPELLFVQLNRVIYNKEKGISVKTNEPFLFEKEIYLDRFMVNNKAEVYHINQQIADLKKELEQKTNDLTKMSNYPEPKMDIIKLLEHSAEFLRLQNTNPQHSFSDPLFIGRIASQEKINIASEILSQYKQTLENKIQELKQNISMIKAKIDNLWSKLNKVKYQLVSILIHDGYAGGGHYYSFTRDIDQETWKRFNDFQVSDESEEVVFDEACGGCTNASAFCLVYLADSIAKEESSHKSIQTPTGHHEAEKNFEIEKQHYSRLLPISLAEEVFIDNLNFQEEVDDFKFTSFLSSVVELYQARYEMVTKALQSKKARSPPTHLNSFGSFLKYDSQFDNILKWYVLDTSLQDMQKDFDNETQTKFQLRNLRNSPHLLQKLSNRLSSLSKPYTFSGLILNSKEENQLECKLAEYTSEFPIIIYTKFLIMSFLNERWRDVCYTAKLVLELEQDPQSFIYKLVKDSVRINCVRMALLIEKEIKEHHFDQALQIFPFLTALVSGILKPEDITVSQVKQILYDSLSEIQDTTSNLNLVQFKEEVHTFQNIFHVTDELDKITEQYTPQDLQKEIQLLANENLYMWRDINQDSPSNQLARLLEGFRSQLKTSVQFYNAIHSTKQICRRDERRKQGFTLID